LPEDTTVEKLKEYSIRENQNSGTWDWKLLNEEWGADLLGSWNLWEKEPANGDQKTEVKFEATNPKPIIITIEFDSESQREVLYSKLQKEGFNCWYGKKKPKD